MTGRARLGFLVLSLLVVALLIAALQHREPPQVVGPPYANVQIAQTGEALYSLFTHHPKEMEEDCLGKALRVHECGDPQQPFTDAEGKKYVVGYRVPDEQAPGGWHDVIRCYLYRPEHPMLKFATGFGGLTAWSATGIYEGKTNGIIILRDCSFQQYFAESADWGQ